MEIIKIRNLFLFASFLVLSSCMKDTDEPVFRKGERGEIAFKVEREGKTALHSLSDISSEGFKVSAWSSRYGDMYLNNLATEPSGGYQVVRGRYWRPDDVLSFGALFSTGPGSIEKDIVDGRELLYIYCVDYDCSDMMWAFALSRSTNGSITFRHISCDLVAVNVALRPSMTDMMAVVKKVSIRATKGFSYGSFLDNGDTYVWGYPGDRYVYDHILLDRDVTLEAVARAGRPVYSSVFSGDSCFFPVGDGTSVVTVVWDYYIGGAYAGTRTSSASYRFVHGMKTTLNLLLTVEADNIELTGSLLPWDEAEYSRDGTIDFSGANPEHWNDDDDHDDDGDDDF